jgi:hypothetical protein
MSKGNYHMNDICGPAVFPTDSATISPARDFAGGTPTVHNGRVEIPKSHGDVYDPATQPESNLPTLGEWGGVSGKI